MTLHDRITRQLLESDLEHILSMVRDFGYIDPLHPDYVRIERAKFEDLRLELKKFKRDWKETA